MTPTRAFPPYALLIIAIVLVAGCAHPPSSSGDLDVRAGCAHVLAEQTMVGPQVVVKVSAAGCHDPDGRPPQRDEAVDRLARAVWQSLELPVDAIHVTVAGPEPPGNLPTAISSDDLAERFGPGPSGVVWPVPEHRPDESIWFLLPIAYAVAGLAMLVLARRLRRGGMIVVLLRR